MENREMILDAVMKDIKKKYGEESIRKLNEKAEKKIEVIPTGSLGIDIALGTGGFPKGRIVEIYGPESSGKTTIALMALAQAQKQNGIVAFIDAEHALDPVYARALGVDLDHLYLSQPDSGEQALGIAEALIKSGNIDLLVIDSVAALVPRAEIDGEMGSLQVGLQARLMSQALRRIASIINKTQTVVIFINQLRMKIGGYGNPETTTGGVALKFYASVRMEIRKGEALKEKEEVEGHMTKIKIAKNKLAPPFKTCEIMILFGQGPYDLYSIVEESVQCGFIQKNGAWYSIGDQKLGQGKENVYKYLEENPHLAQDLKRQVYEFYGMSSAASLESPTAVEEDTKKKRTTSKKKEEADELI